MLENVPAYLPNLMVGLALLLLAAGLMVLDPGSKINQAFALVLFIRSIGYLAGTWRDLYPETRSSVAMFSLGVYALIALVPAVIYFLSVFPRRRGLFGAHRWGPWLLLGITIALMAWYAVDHGALFRFVEKDGAAALEPGPLMLFLGWRLPIFAVAAVVLARDYGRHAHGSEGYSTFLVAAAMTLTAIFDGVANAWWTIEAVSAAGFIPWLKAAAWTEAWYPLCLPLAIVALLYLGKTLRLEKTDATLQEARRFLVVAVPLVTVSGLYAGSLDPEGQVLQLEFMRGLWLLVVPAMVTYALMRFSLFDVDIRLKAGVRRTIMLGAFAVTFFVVSESAEALLGQGKGPVFGIAAAALLAAAAQPLRAGAQKAADQLMPDTVPLHRLSPRRREAMYLDQFMLVGADGHVTSKERRMLGDLAEALHLKPSQTDRLETRGIVRGSDKAPNVPDTPAMPTRTAPTTILVALTTALVLGGVAAFLEFLVPASDFLVGLLSAAAITLLLGPVERLARRLSGQKTAVDAQSLKLFDKELAAALSDGVWSRRDRRYLRGLAGHLGIDPETRRRATRAALLARGLRMSPWRGVST